MAEPKNKASQANIARMACCSRSTVERLLGGFQNLSGDMIIRVYDAIVVLQYEHPGVERLKNRADEFKTVRLRKEAKFSIPKQIRRYDIAKRTQVAYYKVNNILNGETGAIPKAHIKKVVLFCLKKGYPIEPEAMEKLRKCVGLGIKKS